MTEKEEYIKSEAQILKYVAQNIETGYFKITDEQLKTIVALNDEIYRRKKTTEKNNDEER